MAADILLKTAQNVAKLRHDSGDFIPQDETICVIQTHSGRFFSGVSHFDPSIGHVHAEVEAIKSMQATGESAIALITLIGTHSCTNMLPCNNCIGYILSLTPENSNCAIVMPDRMVSILEAGGLAFQNGMAPPSFGMPPTQNLSPHTQNLHTQNYSQRLAAFSQNFTQPMRPQSPQPSPNNPFTQQMMNRPPIADELEEAEPEPASDPIDDSFETNVLKNRVKSLLDVTEDDEPDQSAKKGLFSGFFKH